MRISENPKFLLFFIALFMSGSGILGWKIWSNQTVDLTWFPKPSREIQTGTLIDKFFTENESLPTGNDTTQIAPKLLHLSEIMAVSPVNGNRSGAVMYYDRSNGHVLEVSAGDMSTRSISEQSLPGFVHSIWSPDKKSVISLFSTDRGSQYKYYNFISGKSATLPLNVRSVVFSPDSSQIAVFITTGEVGGIYMAFPDGSNPKKILETRIMDLQLYWPANNDIFFVTKNPNTSTYDLIKLYENGRLENLLTDKQNLQVLLSRDGSGILFSSENSQSATSLSYKNASAGDEVSLSIETTASSCAWSVDNNSVYCGIPGDDKDKEGNELFLPQSVYRISLSDKSKELIFKPTASQTDLYLQSPFLSPLEDHLFFLNGFDGHLYGLRLN